MATTLLALAMISTGLYAGFLFAFWSGIMPALGRLTDEQFVGAMRRVNEAVPGPAFLVLFLAEVAFPAAALAVAVNGRSDTQTWLIAAGLACAVINHLVTVAGNVPLNNALAASEAEPAAEARASFESRWNRLHVARTALAVAAFALLVIASLT